METCSAITCIKQLDDNDRLFCKEHRKAWQGITTQLGLVSEDIARYVLRKFQEGVNALRKE